MTPTILLIPLALIAPSSAPSHGHPTPLPDDDAQKLAVFHAVTAGSSMGGGGECVRQAFVERKAAERAAKADFVHDLANCVNVADFDEQVDCVLEAFAALEEATELAADQFHERLAVCAVIGDGVYAPEIDPADFVKGLDHPYWPLDDPDVTLIYEQTADGELEVIHVSATGDTIEIMGVECTVVRDTVWIDGEIIEDTHDYYAQDVTGNVWYFGEVALNYEDGLISDVAGSWIAGKDHAHAGIILQADNAVGHTYRQEFLLGEAEDMGTVLALDETVDVPAGHFENCLKTFDYSPLEPGAGAEKLYAPGIGTVLEVDIETGDRLELVDIVIDGD